MLERTPPGEDRGCSSPAALCALSWASCALWGFPFGCVRHQRRAEVGLRSPMKTGKMRCFDAVAEGTEESWSAPSFTPLQVLREMFLVFQHQFSSGFQKLPSLSVTLEGVLHLSLSTQCSWNGWRRCAESQDTPKFRGPTCTGTSKPFFHPLTSRCCSWVGGGPARARMPSLKLLVFTVGREKSSKAGLGVPRSVWLLAMIYVCVSSWDAWEFFCASWLD